MMQPELFIVFGMATLISCLMTPLAIKFADRFKLVTDTRTRSHPAHTHTGIIARAGGLPVYIAILTCSIFFIELNKIVIGILVGNGMLILLGLCDDRFDLSPYLRFGLNITIAALVILFGLGIPYISNPFGGVIHLDQWRITFYVLGRHSILVLADILAVFWLVWMMNMVNWSKGVDGQLPGFVSITALFLGLLAQRFTSHDIQTQTVVFLSFITSGAYFGFLPYNFFPQRIMPGYSGGAMAGFMLGILSILSFGKLGTAFLVLSIPMIDAFYTLFRRMVHGHSPFRADWGHFHHRLLEIGWGKRRIALFYWIISLILGIASLFLTGLEKLLTFAAIAMLLLVFMLIIEKIKT